MFSNPNLPFVVSVKHWARLGEIDPVYHLKMTTTRHQCPTRSVTWNQRTWGVQNNYLNPNTSSMKMIAWNYQGVGSVAFHNHAYQLHHRHRPDILIIVEPRIAEERVQVVINTLPYTHSRRVDPNGFSGGIWMLWNESTSCQVEILTHSEHSIHALVKVSSPSLSILLTAIYASSNFYKRQLFWNYLQNLATLLTLPRVLLGDFNDMLSEDEKMGGLPLNRNRVTAFRNCLDTCGLLDLNF